MPFRKSDLPQFTVHSIEQGERDGDDYLACVLNGELNHTRDIPVDTWCFLLLPDRTNLTGTFAISHEMAGIASFSTSSKERPDVVGVTLAQLGSYWQPYHIWMVEDGPEGWLEHIFSASDAVEDTFTAADGSAWRRLAKAPTTPADQSSIRFTSGIGEHSAARIVPGGWDHEHCSLCNTHIDPGDRFFYSLEYCEFLCVTCYERYVPSRDIGFVFE